MAKSTPRNASREASRGACRDAFFFHSTSKRKTSKRHRSVFSGRPRSEARLRQLLLLRLCLGLERRTRRRRLRGTGRAPRVSAPPRNACARARGTNRREGQTSPRPPSREASSPAPTNATRWSPPCARRLSHPRASSESPSCAPPPSASASESESSREERFRRRKKSVRSSLSSATPSRRLRLFASASRRRRAFSRPLPPRRPHRLGRPPRRSARLPRRAPRRRPRAPLEARPSPRATKSRRRG